jgi:dihydroorotate dehydrogenase electron transfer subunit
MNHKRLPLAGRVNANRRLISEHYLMTVTLSDFFPEPLPGQFIMVRLKEREEPFLGRPFSLYHYEHHGDRVSVQILYRVVGKGTRLLSELKRGGVLEIFGPHGHPFDIAPRADNVILISGGVGVAPISYLASYYKKNVNDTGVKILCYLGATTADHLLGLDSLREACSSVKISTDDGSVGYHGMITELFAHEQLSYRPDRSVIYACGPWSMLERLSEILRDHPVPCQVLLEQRMACGVGACLGCVTEKKAAAGENPYVRVCKEGPVFNIEDIIWK